MTISAVGPSFVRTNRGVGDWVVWAVEHPGGIVRVEQRRGLMEVFVGDAPRSATESDTGFAAVACTVDGGAFVRAKDAPPALLIGNSGCRTAPIEPGGHELLSLAADERLLLLSASVLDARPAALSKALHASAEELARRDPVRLLSALFREVQRGAGVMVGRRAPEPSEGDGAR